MRHKEFTRAEVTALQASAQPDIVWRTQYDYQRDAIERANTDIDCSVEPSLTVQGPAAETDINEIVRRFGIGEAALPPEVDPSAYGDLTDLPDLRAVLDLARDAQERFYGLPVALRTKFDNDPAKLWDFVNNPQNFDEAVKIGLLVKPPEPTTPVTIVTEGTPKPAETAGQRKTDTQ